MYAAMFFEQSATKNPTNFVCNGHQTDFMLGIWQNSSLKKLSMLWNQMLQRLQ